MTIPNRRQFLRLVGVTSCGALAGCSSDSGEPSTSDDDETQDDTETPTAEEDDIDPSQTGELVASDGVDEAHFGGSIAVSDDGSTALVGAPNDESGVVYVLSRSDGWSEEAKLTADVGGFAPGFGGSVAISDDGSTALVGARTDDNDNGDQAGSAWVFTESDGWSEEAKLVAVLGDDDDHFGDSVALAGDGSTAVIGAPNAWLQPGETDPDGYQAGAAHVFTRSEEWSQVARLTAEDGDAEDHVGKSVAVSGDGSTAVVGAWNDEDPNGMADYSTSGAGSAYVFTQSGEWSQESKLSADDGDAEDDFGWSVAVSDDGSTALVGAPDAENSDGERAGSTYVFTQSDGWSEEAKLTAEDGDSGDGFGGSVSVSNDGSIALLGANTDDDPNGDQAGSAYVFARSNGWSEAAKLSADNGDAKDQFGVSLAVSGDGSTAIVGAPFHTTSDGEDAGSAYAFEL